jgi:hypothetical protein
MADRHLWAGDSISTYSWCDSVVAARAGATSVARTPFGTINSPAYGGTTLQNGNAVSLLGAWNTRVGQYLGAADRLYIEEGINDFGGFATQGEPQSFNYETWRDAWRQVNVNILAASPRPARIYVFGLPWVSRGGWTAAGLPSWMRGNEYNGRKIMDGITKDACARYGWTYISLATMHPDMQFDGVHPGPSGLTYYINQVLAAG